MRRASGEDEEGGRHFVFTHSSIIELARRALSLLSLAFSFRFLFFCPFAFLLILYVSVVLHDAATFSFFSSSLLPPFFLALGPKTTMLPLFSTSFLHSECRAPYVSAWGTGGESARGRSGPRSEDRRHGVRNWGKKGMAMALGRRNTSIHCFIHRFFLFDFRYARSRGAETDGR